MKTCRICKEEKDNSEFYPNHARCKLCICAEVRNHRRENIEYYQEYDRKRSNLAHRVKARNEYSKTEAGIKASTRAKIKWSKTNLVKRAASQIVNNAVRDGRLEKPNICSECKQVKTMIHGHHDDYAYPMVVRWLCSQCHRDWHKKNNPVNGV